MTKRTYRAAASRKLITVLTLTALVAVGLWIVRLRGADDAGSTEPMTIYCPDCGKQETTEIKWEGPNFLCPECNQYIASYQDPSTKPPPGMGNSP